MKPTQVLGALVTLGGIVILIGNVTGAMPTFAFAGFITMAAGGWLYSAGGSTERAAEPMQGVGAGAQPAAGLHAAPITASASTDRNVQPLSADGRWQWDGASWQPVASAAAAESGSSLTAGAISADGRWQWDGANWQMRFVPSETSSTMQLA